MDTTTLHARSLMFEKAMSYIVYFTVYLLVLIPYVDKLLFRKQKKVIGFAYDYFSGNIKYLYPELEKYPDVEAYFVTRIKTEVKKLKLSGINAYYSQDIKKIPLFLKTDVWVTSHGPNYIPFRGIRRLIPSYTGKRYSKWVDVWHGIPFKDVGREKMLREYDLGFVTSAFFKEYLLRKAVISEKLAITGFARTDPLFRKIWNREKILKEIGIPLNRKNILYAPTWGHGKEKPFLPWKTNIENFEDIEKFCKRSNCNFLIRIHTLWNQGDPEEKKELQAKIRGSSYLFNLAWEKYPNIQRILYITDLLVTDWSSIANDFILLDKPIIFLDIDLPTEEFTLKPEERVGYLVRTRTDFFEKLQEALVRPDLFKEERRIIIKKIYDEVDGNSAKRCAKAIIKLLRM